MPKVRAFAAAHDAEVVLTERSRHACELSQQALHAGCDLIVAVGGDGTMNEVASTLIDAPAALGLIPCGSGDGLGRHLGIHGTIDHALRILGSGTVRRIDVGYADGQPFFTAAGIGFEAHIAEKFNTLRARGFARYVSTSARAFLDWQPESYSVTTGAERLDVRAFTLAVSNSDQYGNDAIIAPGARADDGLLDLCAIPSITVFNAAPLLLRLFHGSLNREPAVLLRRAAAFTVERSAPGPFHTDGEVHQAGTKIEFTIRPGALRVMGP